MDGFHIHSARLCRAPTSPTLLLSNAPVLHSHPCSHEISAAAGALAREPAGCVEIPAAPALTPALTVTEPPLAPLPVTKEMWPVLGKVLPVASITFPEAEASEIQTVAVAAHVDA